MSGHVKSELSLGDGAFERHTRESEPFKYSSTSKRSSAAGTFPSSGTAPLSRSPPSRHRAMEELASGSDAVSASQRKSPDIVHGTKESSPIMSQRSTTESSESGCPAVSSQADAPEHIAEYIPANRQDSLRKSLMSSFRTLGRSHSKPSLADSAPPGTNLHPQEQTCDDDDDALEELQIDAILRPSQTPSSSPTDYRPQVTAQRSMSISSAPHESLFTPPSSPPRKRRISKFSHIAVPSFPAGLSKRDYKPIHFSCSAIKKPANTGTYVHSSITQALQAAMTNNAAPASRAGSSTHLDFGREDVQSLTGTGTTRTSRRRSARPPVGKGQVEEPVSRSLKRKRSPPIQNGIRNEDVLREPSHTQPSSSDAAKRHLVDLTRTSVETRSSRTGGAKERPVVVIARSPARDAEVRWMRHGVQAKQTARQVKTSNVDAISISSEDEQDQETMPADEQNIVRQRNAPLGSSEQTIDNSSPSKAKLDFASTKSDQLQPAFDDGESATDIAGPASQISARSKPKQHVPPRLSAGGEKVLNTTHANSTQNDLMPQASPNALQSAFNFHTPSPKRHKSPHPSDSSNSNRIRPGYLTSPVARLKNGLLSNVVGSPGGGSIGKVADRRDLSSPSYSQLFQSPSNFIADLEASGSFEHGLSAVYDHFFDDLDRPRESRVGTPFETNGLIRSGQDIMLADGINEHDTNELFGFSVHQDPSSPNLGPQPTKAGESLPISSSALDLFLSPHTSGGNLAVQDAIAQEDVREWFIEAEEDRHPSASAESTSEFSGSGTIDPSLLRGGFAQPLVPPSISRSVSPESVTEEPGSDVQSTPRQRTLVEARKPSTRISRAPLRVDMVATEDIIRSSDSSDDAISSSSEGSDVRPKHSKSGKTGAPLPISTLDRLSPANAESKSGLLPPTAKIGRPRKVNIPISVGSEFSCCHHCRRSTWKAKMVCSGLGDRSQKSREACVKKWCDLCIAKHYPEITFASDNRTFICPWCHDTCRCSVCTRKRGEEYIGERTISRILDADLKSSRHSSAPDEKRKRVSTKKLLPPQPLSPLMPPEPALLGKATTFWGTIYGLTGERVGKAFVTDDGDDRFVVAHSLTSAGIGPPAKPVKRRVFIGKVQEWWGIKGFRDLEPVPTMTRKQRLNPSAVRFYIGDKSCLRARCRPRSPSPAFSFGSSELTELSDEMDGAGIWTDKPEEGLLPHIVSLGEVDVARAITAAVTALGKGSGEAE